MVAEWVRIVEYGNIHVCELAEMDTIKEDHFNPSRVQRSLIDPGKKIVYKY